MSGRRMPAAESAPNSHSISADLRCAAMFPTNFVKPDLIPFRRFPRKPIGSRMIVSMTSAAFLRTPSSMSLSCRIVRMTPPIAANARSTSPRLAAFISSIRASTAPRAST